MSKKSSPTMPVRARRKMSYAISNRFGFRSTLREATTTMNNTRNPSSPFALPPNIASLDRTDSSTSSTVDTLSTPSIESNEEIHITQQDISEDDIRAIKKGVSTLHQSKSMQGLKPAQPIKDVKKSGLRNRAFSASETK